MPTATLTTATVETIGKPKESKHKPGQQYRPVLFTLPTGEQKWKSYAIDAPELTWLAKGATYQATIAGDEFTIIQPDSPPSIAQSPTPTAPPKTTPTSTPTLSPDQKRAIASYVDELARVQGYCLQAARNTLGSDWNEETIRACGNSLFIAAQRKFDL
ncbi:MAG: hypothetical protein VKK04_25700 [Synechococcales bacterium]|nr:hypothetical protein [Synechococcales bacterium]